MINSSLKSLFFMLQVLHKIELKKSELFNYQQRCDICHQLRHHIKSMVGISTEFIGYANVMTHF
ncbi:hypothetical protein FE393_05115 [Xenorhabdus sp. psl]|nr:hypothetical protein [Xenorhabdus sp. psl]